MAPRGSSLGGARAALAFAAAAAICLVAIVTRGRPRSPLLLSTEYWSQYYADAPAYPRMATGYPSYAAMMPVRRPSFYNADVDVEEAIGLPTTTIDDLNFKTKEGKEMVAKMVDVIASVAFSKKIDEVEDEDRNKVEISDITPIPAVRTVSDMYPDEREEGVRVDFVVKADDAHAADGIIGRLTEAKLTKGLRDEEVIPKPDEDQNIKLGNATILSVTTSAFATPLFDDNQTWGLENATQNSAYQEYLKGFYRSAHADRSRWPWMDKHMIFGVLGGDNGYEVSARCT